MRTVNGTSVLSLIALTTNEPFLNELAFIPSFDGF
jgi:hypothetical protein